MRRVVGGRLDIKNNIESRLMSSDITSAVIEAGASEKG